MKNSGSQNISLASNTNLSISSNKNKKSNTAGKRGKDVFIFLSFWIQSILKCIHMFIYADYVEQFKYAMPTWPVNVM